MLQREVAVDARFQSPDVEETEVRLQGVPAACRGDGPEGGSRVFVVRIMNATSIKRRGRVEAVIGSSLLLFFGLPLPRLPAVDFYDGVRAPQGLYLLPYTNFYWADRVTDAGGDTALRDLGLFRASQLIRFSYYTPELVFNILVPFGYIRIGHYDESSSGLGDIWAGGGGFLPVREVDLLLMVNAKFPTGEYDSGKSVNFGSNQFDVGPALFIHRTWGDFSLDGAVKYYFKLENRSTETDPGDDLHLQALFGYEIVPGVKIGPGVNWLLGGNRKVNGRTVPSSARELLSVGGEVYVKLPPVSVTVNYLNEIYSENAPRGHFSKIKLCYKF